MTLLTLEEVRETDAVHLRTGMRGEKIAAKFLRKLGYRIDGRNVRLGKDEIDIVAFDPATETMIFAEVKTRSRRHEDYRPELNADWHKVRRLQRSARKWVAEHSYEGGYRIDLLCVADGMVIEHIQELSWDDN